MAGRGRAWAVELHTNASCTNGQSGCNVDRWDLGASKRRRLQLAAARFKHVRTCQASKPRACVTCSRVSSSDCSAAMYVRCRGLGGWLRAGIAVAQSTSCCRGSPRQLRGLGGAFPFFRIVALAVADPFQCSVMRRRRARYLPFSHIVLFGACTHVRNVTTRHSGQSHS